MLSLVKFLGKYLSNLSIPLLIALVKLDRLILLLVTIVLRLLLIDFFILYSCL